MIIMKKLLYSVIFVVSPLFLGISSSNAQCEPDTVTCRDTLQPGEFCPKVLPDGFIGQPYSEVITVIPPGSYFYSGFEVEVLDLVVQDVKNLPPGITYESSADTLYPDSAYCVLLSGTPETAGVYDLGITVSVLANIPNLGVLRIDSITDDTSVSMVIHAGSGLDDPAWEDQFVFCGPNPFNNTTEIRLKSQGIEDTELVVYNLLGGIVYREQMRTSPGLNSYRFDGQDLRHGTYIYHISTKDEIYTNRLLKLRD
jgi:hypothetical protein